MHDLKFVSPAALAPGPKGKKWKASAWTAAVAQLVDQSTDNLWALLQPLLAPTENRREKEKSTTTPPSAAVNAVDRTINV